MGEPSLDWAIIGPGTIAAQFAADMARSGAGRIRAVVSRDEARARAFAEVHCPSARSFSSPDAMIASGLARAVYVATPHTAHRHAAEAAMAAGLSVLIEKPIAATLGDTDAIVAATSGGAIAREALWSLCLPATRSGFDAIRGGRIGALRSIRAELAFHRAYDPNHRLFDPAQGGGVLLDLGVYPLALAHALAGPLQLDAAQCGHAANGVIDDVDMQLHGSSVKVHVGASFRRNGTNLFVATGERGAIILAAPFLKAQGFWIAGASAARLLEAPGAAGKVMRALTRRIPVPGFRWHDHRFDGGGLQFEIADFSALVAGNDAACRLPKLADSRAVMALMTEVERRAQAASRT